MSAFLEPVEKGRRIVVDKAVIFIGRHADCDVVLTRSRKVSRKHCCVAQVDNRYYIRDLGSMNGVRINGKRVLKVARLNAGDEVAIGDVKYRFQLAAGGPKQHNGSMRPPAEPLSEHVVGLPSLPSEDYPVPIPEDEAGAPPKRPAGFGLAEKDRNGQHDLGVDDDVVELADPDEDGR